MFAAEDTGGGVTDMIEELRRSFLFADLGENQLRRIANHAVRVRLNEGDALFEQGDPA